MYSPEVFLFIPSYSFEDDGGFVKVYILLKDIGALADERYPFSKSQLISKFTGKMTTLLTFENFRVICDFMWFWRSRRFCCNCAL